MKVFVLAGFLVISLVVLEGNCNPANDLDLKRSYLVGVPQSESALGGILQKSSLQVQESALPAVPQSSGLCVNVEVDLISTILAVVQNVAEAVFNYLGGNVIDLVHNVGKIVQAIALYGICEFL